MKHRTLVVAALAAMAFMAAGCGKQKDCRCAVRGSSVVRIIKIEKGECEQIKEYSYHNAVDTLMVDSLLCTGYEFEIDTIFND